MGIAARSKMGPRRIAGLALAGGILAASFCAVDRPTAEAAPHAVRGPAHMNPTSWNPTDNNEPFESTAAHAFDSRMPDATRTGSSPRTGVGSFHEACLRILNTWPPIEPAYLTWRVKVESTDNYFAAASEVNKLLYFLNTAHAASVRGLAGVPGYERGIAMLQQYDDALMEFRDMIRLGGGAAPVLPDAGIPWERWDAAWQKLSQAHDEVLRTCPVS